jgi:hypothetical protein
MAYGAGRRCIKEWVFSRATSIYNAKTPTTAVSTDIYAQYNQNERKASPLPGDTVGDSISGCDFREGGHLVE